MGKFVAYLKQKGEGCDYTIGCARTLITIDADNMDDAKDKMIEKIKEEFQGETELSSCIIYEVSNEIKLPLNSIYKEIEDEKKLKKQKNEEEKEKKELERLIKKYGDFKKE